MEIVYNNIKNNKVRVIYEEDTVSVFLNEHPIMETSEKIEAELVAEGIDLALQLLDSQKKLKD